jgi:Conjugal transfer protein TraD
MTFFVSKYSESEGQAHRGHQLAALTQTDQGTVLGLLLEGAQRLHQEQATRQRWQVAGVRSWPLVPKNGGCSSRPGNGA